MDKEPYNGGSVSPDSGYYREGTGFSATANSGCKFHHWLINGYSKSYSRTYQAWNPCKLKAIFYIRVRLYVYDSEYYGISGLGTRVYLDWKYPESVSGNRYEWYVPKGSHTLSVSYRVTAFGYTVGFYKWSDGITSTSRTIYVYSPASYTAYYKTKLLFRNVKGAWGWEIWGIKAKYAVWGEVVSVHGKKVSGVTVSAKFRVYNGIQTFYRYSSATTNWYGSFTCEATGYDWPISVKADITASKRGYESVTKTGISCPYSKAIPT